MKITAIELYLYKRMKLNTFKKIRIDFTKPIQQILGSNGTGKSSLLSQLNPLASEARDFEKGGYKHIWLTHRGSTYEAISEFASGAHHTFIKDGITLNDKGIARIQNELVSEHLGFDKEMRDLLLGKISFTLMSVADRKKWLNKLSTVDYGYANTAYQYFKERLRDASGALKENKRRLTFEESKLLKEEERVVLEKEIREHHATLSFLYEYRAPPTQSMLNAQSEYESLDGSIKLNLLSILKTPLFNPSQNDSEAALIDAIDRLKAETANLQARLEEKTKSYTEVHQDYLLLSQTGLKDSKELENLISEYKLKVKKLLLGIHYKGLNFPNATESLETLIRIKEPLTHCILELPNNQASLLGTLPLKAEEEKLLNILMQKQKVSEYLIKIQERKEHFDEHKKNSTTTCPKCHYEWVLAFDPTQYEKTVEHIEKCVKKLSEIEKLEKESRSIVEANRSYCEAIKRVFGYIESSFTLNPFWSLLEASSVIHDSPTQITLYLDRLEADLVLLNKVKDLERECHEKEKLLELSKHFENKSLYSLQTKQEELSLEINTLSATLKEKRSELSLNQSFLKEAQDLKLQFSNTLALVDRAIHKENQIVECVKFKVVDSVIQMHQSALAQKESLLSNIQTLLERKKFLESTIKELEKESLSLTYLTQLISPTEGLIAKGLSHFIDHFVAQVNHEIASIWSYPLEVKSCALPDSDLIELDYKFPLYVGDEDNIVSDVSEGSSGMQEVVNIAFTLVAMKFLDLLDYPIYLDEFGNTFDEYHRKRTIYFIKALIENYNFTQLFMISHFYTMHGALSNTEICVLNEENVNVVEPYNLHVHFD